MRKKRCVPDEERLITRGFDEVEDRLQPIPPDREALIAVPAAPVWITVRHASGEAAASVIALPPFARLETGVTPVSQ